MGISEGVGEGFLVGSAVGDAVGEREGDAEGSDVGLVLGDILGSTEGLPVGPIDGDTVGGDVGLEDGRDDGRSHRHGRVDRRLSVDSDLGRAPVRLVAHLDLVQLPAPQRLRRLLLVLAHRQVEVLRAEDAPELGARRLEDAR